MSRHNEGEDDVAADPNVTSPRVTGGLESSGAEDQASTTATSTTEDYVGRIAGDDVGDAGQTGAEARAEQHVEDGSGPSPVAFSSSGDTPLDGTPQKTPPLAEPVSGSAFEDNAEQGDTPE